jgi:hypothetical protein
LRNLRREIFILYPLTLTSAESCPCLSATGADAGGNVWPRVTA